MSSSQKSVSVSKETGRKLKEMSARLTVQNSGYKVSQDRTIELALYALEKLLRDIATMGSTFPTSSFDDWHKVYGDR